MPKRNEVYKCELCGNIVEVLNGKTGALVCCGQNMKLMREGVVDASLEKHVPVIEITPNGIKVSVGSIEHPMLQEHYIEWIEVIADNKICRKYLNPGEKPEAEFPVKAENITVREYCNLHGLWKGE
ncbi:MAG TPA: desulfoferrodoxin [Candidatus Gastranaerophilales bacterium]|nr:desulfoferrodoxin [Candidatus Gastranaerophilales bacterium]